MSLRSGSPCTSTSRPSASCLRMHARRSRRSTGLVGCGVESAPARARAARRHLGGLRERADRRGRAAPAGASRWRAARPARSAYGRGAAASRGVTAGDPLGARRRRWTRGDARRAARRPPAGARARRRRHRARRSSASCSDADLVERLPREGQPGRTSGSRLVLAREVDGHVQQRAGRREVHTVASPRRPATADRGDQRLEVGAPDVAAVDDAERERQVVGAQRRARRRAGRRRAPGRGAARRPAGAAASGRSSAEAAEVGGEQELGVPARRAQTRA